MNITWQLQLVCFNQLHTAPANCSPNTPNRSNVFFSSALFGKIIWAGRLSAGIASLRSRRNQPKPLVTMQMCFSGQPLSYPGEKMLWSAFQGCSKKLWDLRWCSEKNMKKSNAWSEEHAFQFLHQPPLCAEKLPMVHWHMMQSVGAFAGPTQERSRTWNGRLNNQDLPVTPHGLNCQSVQKQSNRVKVFWNSQCFKTTDTFPQSGIHWIKGACFDFAFTRIQLHASDLHSDSESSVLEHGTKGQRYAMPWKALSTRRLGNTAPHKSFETSLTFQLIERRPDSCAEARAFTKRMG